MATSYRLNIYQLDRPHLLLACFTLDVPCPDIPAGAIIQAQAVGGLDVFSPLLEVVYTQFTCTILQAEESRQQLLLFTKAYYGLAQVVIFARLPALRKISNTL